ncbi:hypothetical protein [Achromobacter phage Motura]|uniref:Uncharacterized protein n=1 Tax=Achromobacter phage Motura TaxID=2591403 RepID=A0A514CSF5_9CAUD|nr:hypothetical protein H1O15_gp058 [Achromobacter phage Motura]QDH83404.1 hypothetical protein [Achromobacter phage Motura]
MLKEFTITVSKTIQTKQFEPLTITISEVHTHKGEDRNELKKVRIKYAKTLSRQIKKLIEGEAEEYRE